MPGKRTLVVFISIVQLILFLGHLFLYQTWTFALPANASAHLGWVKVALAILSVSFVASSLLAFRYTNSAVRAFYKAAAVWLGLFSFLFVAAAASWVVFAISRLANLAVNFHRIVEVLFALGTIVGLYALFNASWTRITRVTVRLANLPDVWRGRKAALISDLHLGHVRNGSFLRRMVADVLKENPDAVFITGDLYDGTAIDARGAAEPLRQLAAPQGVYFIAGNHEQFGDDSNYLNAVSGAGVRVLSNEKVEV